MYALQAFCHPQAAGVPAYLPLCLRNLGESYPVLSDPFPHMSSRDTIPSHVPELYTLLAPLSPLRSVYTSSSSAPLPTPLPSRLDLSSYSPLPPFFPPLCSSSSSITSHPLRPIPTQSNPNPIHNPETSLSRWLQTRPRRLPTSPLMSSLRSTQSLTCSTLLAPPRCLPLHFMTSRTLVSCDNSQFYLC